MFAIVLMLADFMWIGRGMRYKKHARYLRVRNLLAPPLLNSNGSRNLDAPDIPEDDFPPQQQPIAIVAVYAQPSTSSSPARNVPIATDVKLEAMWETEESSSPV